MGMLSQEPSLQRPQTLSMRVRSRPLPATKSLVFGLDSRPVRKARVHSAAESAAGPGLSCPLHQGLRSSPLTGPSLDACCRCTAGWPRASCLLVFSLRWAERQADEASAISAGFHPVLLSAWMP